MFDLRDDLDEENKALELKVLNTVIKSLGSKYALVRGTGADLLNG